MRPTLPSLLVVSLSLASGAAVLPPPSASAQREAAVAFPSGWRGKVLVMRGGDVVLDQGATYADTNGDGVMDPGDAGWFAPGSTVKVAIALAAIAHDGGRANVASDVTSMLVVSDNEATNRLISRVGGPAALTRRLRDAGYTRFIVGRPMMADGGVVPGCEEAPGRLGNCASARELLKSLRAVVDGGPHAMGVSEGDRKWLAGVMAKTPRQAGFSQADDYCRFARRPGLQKCGVSPWGPQHWTNIGYFPQQDAYVFVGVVPPSGTSVDRVVDVIDAAVGNALASAGTATPVAPPPPARQGKAVALEDTWLKTDTRDDAALPDGEKCFVPAGTVLAYAARVDVELHARLRLKFADISCPTFPLEGVHVYRPFWNFEE